MGLLVRYFSTTGAGAADGTSWANRAALTDGSNFSTIITENNFTNDGMLCLVGPGTYNHSQRLTSSIFTVATPTAKNQLVFQAVDSNGNIYRAQPSNWSAAQSLWDTSNMPRLHHTANSAAVWNMNNIAVYDMVISVGGSWAFNFIDQNVHFSRCYIYMAQTSSTTGVLVSAGTYIDCWLEANGTVWNHVVIAGPSMHNCRINGNKNATSSGRNGWVNNTSNTTYVFRNIVITNMPGYGISYDFTGTASSLGLTNFLIANCGNGIRFRGNGTANSITWEDGVIVNCDAYAILIPSGYVHNARWNNLRVRNCPSGISVFDQTGWESSPTIYTASGTDANEFVNVANNDYRIKYGSEYWGMSLGLFNEPAPSQAATGIKLGRLISGGV